MKLKPLGDRVLVRMDLNKEEKTESGIILAEKQQKHSVMVKAEILAIGCGMRIKRLGLKEKDIVCVNKFAAAAEVDRADPYVRILGLDDLFGKWEKQ